MLGISSSNMSLDEVERMVYMAGDAPVISLFHRAIIDTEEAIQSDLEPTLEEAKDKAFTEGREQGRDEGEQVAKDRFERLMYRHLKALVDVNADLSTMYSDVQFLRELGPMRAQAEPGLDADLEDLRKRLLRSMFKVSAVIDELDDPEFTYLKAATP